MFPAFTISLTPPKCVEIRPALFPLASSKKYENSKKDTKEMSQEAFTRSTKTYYNSEHHKMKSLAKSSCMVSFGLNFWSGSGLTPSPFLTSCSETNTYRSRSVPLGNTLVAGWRTAPGGAPTSPPAPVDAPGEVAG